MNTGQRARSLAGQACLLVNNLDAIIRRLLFARIPEEAKIELPMRDFRVLELIESDGPLTMTDFAALLRMPVSTATHAVTRLEKKGLAERERSEPDRRVVRVSATEPGRTLVRSHVELRRAMARDMLRPLSAAERDVFLDLLAKMSRLAVLSENSKTQVTKNQAQAPVITPQ
jgi:DNA-binding MarR family transcriptional regulator